ncbi:MULTISPECIES: NUDIX hydrolase [unclassified Arthrobacter]|uniref:NUDIX hydrolase n=1 Tax=unclassified Arthrobacter TaxID=235627 RepID=UPI00031ACFDB|nr:MULTISPECIES: NUDIX hydrolase [unclassified Arthrobacter]PVE19062.1 NUDIX domain-containing protein [Arthrobacter sp. Bz4]
MSAAWDTRIGAYGLIIDNGKILLAHWNESGAAGWTLPGGGLELGEDAPAAAVREIYEETGYTAELDHLLGVDSLHIAASDRLNGSDRPMHALRIVYRARTIDGSLRHEANGSTDRAAWVNLSDLPTLDRVGLVDVALCMENLL